MHILHGCQKKTWMFIDEISSRKCGKTLNISYIKVNNESINSVVEMAED